MRPAPPYKVIFDTDPGVDDAMALYFVRVATDGLAQGQTMMNRNDFRDYAQLGWGKDKPLTEVCMQVQAQTCQNVFQNILEGAWLSR